MQNFTATFKDGTTRTRESDQDLTHAVKIQYADGTTQTIFAARRSELVKEIKLDREFAPADYEGAEIEIVELDVAL